VQKRKAGSHKSKRDGIREGFITGGRC